MSVLWYAIGIYIVGVAVVLYIRPRTMFRENGLWREFGLATETEQTIFPFWMFAIIWAILSYALANLISIFFASVALSSTGTTPATSNTSNIAPPNASASFIQPISGHPNMPMAPIMPTAPTAPAMNTKAPGYYILDPYATPAHPRYLYYGPEPPGGQV